jgi:hypothetical protein
MKFFGLHWIDVLILLVYIVVVLWDAGCSFS